eukprot:UN33173
MSLDDANIGLVAPYAAVKMFSETGAWMILIQLFMAVTSTGSAELIAVASLITYDVYATYINPNCSGDKLLIFSRFCIIGAGCCMVVIGILFKLADVSLSFVYSFIGVLVGSAVFPIGSVLLWNRISANAAI